MSEIKTLREMNSNTKQLTAMIVHDLVHPTRAVVSNLKEIESNKDVLLPAAKTVAEELKALKRSLHIFAK